MGTLKTVNIQLTWREIFNLLVLFKTIEYWWLITFSPLKKKLPLRVDKTSEVVVKAFSWKIIEKIVIYDLDK